MTAEPTLKDGHMNSTSFQIRLFNDSDAEAWNQFVLSHPQGTMFHTVEWKTVIEETFGHRSHYLLAESTDSENRTHLAGILPLFEIRSRLFGHSLISVPFAEKGGALAESPSSARHLLERASSLAEQMGAAYVELRNSEHVDGLPAKDLYYSFRKEILSESDANLKAIPRKQRRMVRVGLKSGLKAEFGQDRLPDFYRLLAISFHRLGTPIFTCKLFENFIRAFGDQVSVMVVLEPGGSIVAGVMSFYFQDTVLPYYAGSLTEYRNMAPNDFMYWSLMEHGRQNGYTWFDFGRSKIETGSFKFKKHWGFEPEPLAYQYLLNTAREIPNISPANPKYQKRIELWRKLPLWSTKVIGPMVSKYLC